ATLFQRLADERGLAVRSTFAGTEPDPAIQPNVVARLLEEGVDVRPLRPRRVTRDELASAWRVVSFGCDLTALAPDARIERQAELQEKRQWVSKERFVEGLSLVNMLPGASAAQLSMFLGYARGGWWGGLLGGLCFVLPGFFILLALTMGYAALGVTPIMRGALYGLGPVVLGIYLVAVYRLGRAAVSTFSQALVAVAAAAAVIFSPIGIAATLLLAGGTG